MLYVRSSCFHFGNSCNFLQSTTLHNEPTTPEVQTSFVDDENVLSTVITNPHLVVVVDSLSHPVHNGLCN